MNIHDRKCHCLLTYSHPRSSHPEDHDHILAVDPEIQENESLRWTGEQTHTPHQPHIILLLPLSTTPELPHQLVPLASNIILKPTTPENLLCQLAAPLIPFKTLSLASSLASQIFSSNKSAVEKEIKKNKNTTKRTLWWIKPHQIDHTSFYRSQPSLPGTLIVFLSDGEFFWQRAWNAFSTWQY